MRRHDRLIDPRGMGQGIRERKLGAVPESVLAREQEKTDRFEREHPFILTATIGPWFRENVPASGDQTMRLLALQTSSTNPATPNDLYNSSAGGNAAFVTTREIRVIGGALHTPSTITAGTATLGVRIGSSDVRYLTDCVLNATHTVGKVSPMPGWTRGIIVPAGESITAIVTTSSGFLPTTADMSAWLIIGWHEPG